MSRFIRLVGRAARGRGRLRRAIAPTCLCSLPIRYREPPDHHKLFILSPADRREPRHRRPSDAAKWYQTLESSNNYFLRYEKDRSLGPRDRPRP
ncbi:hypothetical protein EVAR_36135_1 [Eumeta japonica]|uniref:Uncharacterized protein n=1 Tax=Eumeta variegata TaxID=151549 RepID=A0A4C1X2U9_EUMVA|nr:hypothetical protein EVAR_36135_1 [Eumeta japonica]